MRSSNELRVGGRRRRICAAVLCSLVLRVAIGEIARAAPFIPSDDAQVLERLPPRSGAEWDAIRKLRAETTADSSSAELAAELARRYLDLFRVEGDPRLVAYAKTAIAPWSHDAEPPAEILLQRALVAQTEHRFEAAAIDLEHLGARAPREPQTWLTLAAMALARGDFAREPQSVRPRLVARGRVGCRGVLRRLARDDRSGREGLRFLELCFDAADRRARRCRRVVARAASCRDSCVVGPRRGRRRALSIGACARRACGCAAEHLFAHGIR